MEMIPSESGFPLSLSQPPSLVVGSLLVVAERAAGAPKSHRLRIEASGKEPAPSMPSKSLHASLCPSLNPSIMGARGTGCPEEARLRWHPSPKAMGGSAPLKSQIGEDRWVVVRREIGYDSQKIGVLGRHPSSLALCPKVDLDELACGIPGNRMGYEWVQSQAE